jgi:hypothetical protein
MINIPTDLFMERSLKTFNIPLYGEFQILNTYWYCNSCQRMFACPWTHKGQSMAQRRSSEYKPERRDFSNVIRVMSKYIDSCAFSLPIGVVLWLPWAVSYGRLTTNFMVTLRHLSLVYTIQHTIWYNTN